MSGSTLMALVMNIEIKWRDSRGRMGKSGAGYHNMDEGLFNMAEALWSGVPHLNPRKSGVASLGTGAQGPDPDSGGGGDDDDEEDGESTTTKGVKQKAASRPAAAAAAVAARYPA
jgi:hypothetical protein